MNALSKLKPKIKPYEEDAEIIIFSNLYLILTNCNKEEIENVDREVDVTIKKSDDYEPVIKGFEWGINDSPEKFHQDFTIRALNLLGFKEIYPTDLIFQRI